MELIYSVWTLFLALIVAAYLMSRATKSPELLTVAVVVTVLYALFILISILLVNVAPAGPQAPTMALLTS